MTRERFKEILNELQPSLYWHRELALPEAAKQVAIHCFINKIKNELTEELRNQLICLKCFGMFDFPNQKEPIERYTW